MATWPGMRERTITISGLSKTFSCTGWRLGYAIAPAELSVADPEGARLPDGRRAGAAAGGGRGRHGVRRRLLQPPRARLPRAARHACARRSTKRGSSSRCRRARTTSSRTSRRLSDLERREFAKWMAKEVGVATVPGIELLLAAGAGRDPLRASRSARRSRR